MPQFDSMFSTYASLFHGLRETPQVIDSDTMFLVHTPLNFQIVHYLLLLRNITHSLSASAMHS
jgi:hypothetical protein